MNPTENPPAFPSGLPNGGTSRVQGMSLRDWFAGQALAGLCACPAVAKIDGKSDIDVVAYLLADAMLSHRNKPV